VRNGAGAALLLLLIIVVVAMVRWIGQARAEMAELPLEH